MRSTLIIASMALAILAAPVPVPEDQVPELLMDKRYHRTSDGGLVNSDSPHVFKRAMQWHSDGKDKREPNSHSVEDEEKVGKRQAFRFNGKLDSGNRGRSDSRSVEGEEEVEKRDSRYAVPGGGHRNTKRESRIFKYVSKNDKLNSRSVEDEEEMEERSIRTYPRSEEDKEQEEERSIRTHPRSEEDKEEVKERSTRPYPESRGIVLSSIQGENIEARGNRDNEQGGRPGSNKRAIKETRGGRGPVGEGMPKPGNRMF